jgi:hypothetical protein
MLFTFLTVMARKELPTLALPVAAPLPQPVEAPLKRQDEEHFGGLREAVLQRDGYCCRICRASGHR